MSDTEMQDDDALPANWQAPTDEQFSEMRQIASEGDARAALDHPAVASRIAELEAALTELEQANEVVCAGRSQGVYDLMILDGQSDALLALDVARRRARDAILNSQNPIENPDNS